LSGVNDIKTITGYCEPLSLRAGESVRLMASSHRPGPATLDLVQIVCGDPTRTGPGFDEIEVSSALPPTIDLTEQPLVQGSFAEIDLNGLVVEKNLEIEFHVRPTLPSATQTVWSIDGAAGTGIAVQIRQQCFTLMLGDQQIVLSPNEIVANRWYRIRIQAKLASDPVLDAVVECLPSRSPGRDLLEVLPPSVTQTSIEIFSIGELKRCLFAASPDGERFDGRLARPQLHLDEVSLQWDLAQDISGRQLIDVSGNERHGRLYQLPARGVTGPDWDGTHHAWTSNPKHYDAVHFHSDDLYDAAWEISTELELAQDLPSGIYAFRLHGPHDIDRIPFFVRPNKEAPTADVALLMSSCTYMAYANHRMLFEGADFVAARSRLRPEHEYLRDHPEVGLSMYEKHRDGSGVMYSSRRRPNLQLRPGADGWNFTPDTDINAFLDRAAVGHDIIADEDVHAEGLAALAPYRVIVTGSHPEYWSTVMLNALDEWQRAGGRLLYIGGNGFYWRVAFSDAWPGAIELRRAEDGVRNWQTETGESYHSFNGEYGGMWRRLGRPPNELVGVGFAAQGFERAIGYQRNPASYASRAAWIFDGVSDANIGTSGLGGGAAGQEVDSYNPALGSPAHALVLASATDFGPEMTRTKEELEAATIVPVPDPVVRADIVFFETPAGGAVFSVGSISWFGALARNDYDNDVAQITENVLRRFIDPAAFPLP
jgi:N,N-dimethylformamidase